MRPKPPCRKNGVDCPSRCVGCQSRCEEYKTYRTAIDADNAVRQKEWDSADLVNQMIYRKRHSLRYTDAGRRALAQR